MWSNGIYKPGVLTDVLEQGDVMERSPALVDLLERYHPHYAKHDDNRFYVVLTQSCDLVRRDAPCNARYIAIAPARPLKTVIRREFENKLHKLDEGAPYSSLRVCAEIERFLGHLFDNNESSYFYLEEEPAAGLYEPMCAVLALPISLKAEHYEVLLNAKIIGIEDSFQAKLGWLLGQLYSRVGTPDTEPTKMKEKIAAVTGYLALWLEQSEVDALGPLTKAWKEKNPNQPLNEAVIQVLVKSIPKKKALAIEKVLDSVTTLDFIKNPSPERRRLRLALENDPGFAAFFR